MKENKYHIILTIALIITMIGIVTNKFLFLLLLFPFGMGLFNKSDSEN